MIDSVETLEGKANTAVITINGVESLWFYGTLIGVRGRDGAYHVQRDGEACLLYTSPSPRDLSTSRMPSSA